MKYKRLVAIPLLMAAAFGLGRWWDRHDSTGAATGPRILYYHDPMHPSYRSDKPGIAPDCGMELVPVYAEGSAPAENKPAGLAPGAVKISPERQQLIGVRLAAVERAPGTDTLRATGRVVPDEARVYRMNAKVDGWVRKVYPETTGSFVKKGQPLLSVSSREFQNAQVGFLFAINQLAHFDKGTEPDAGVKLAAREARAVLTGMGMTEEEIDRVADTKLILQNISLVAPITGFIATRAVYFDQRFDKGADFYTIVDLSHVWILADVYEQEARYLTPGATARISLPHDPGTAFQARVAATLPQVDPVSRTLKVRLEVDNPHFDLKPDMYVDVRFAMHTPPAIMVPADAIIDSGLARTVFVDRGEGYFEPREVETGARFGDRVAIVRGLAEGERIVVSGTFLIDSESRLKTAAASGERPRAVTDPVCGMTIAGGVSQHHAEHAGRTFQFCSEKCLRQFQSNPAHYAGPPTGSGPAGTPGSE
ncbi:MAG: efflux RND transporter periplasmic adaptor subunit [Acidobacteriia bacterium]|nr:efflux RND transporter periplasmic adaptor subunit [Terriglobia bacterium]